MVLHEKIIFPNQSLRPWLAIDATLHFSTICKKLNTVQILLTVVDNRNERSTHFWFYLNEYTIIKGSKNAQERGLVGLTDLQTLLNHERR